MDNRPDIIFNIGTSCSGKSTFSSIVKKQFPDYEILDDVTPLHEIFAIEELVYHYINSTETKNSILEKLINKRDELIYTKPLLNEYCLIISDDNLNDLLLKSESLNNGSYKILNPIIWDTIIELLLDSLESKKYIIEFARGADVDYINAFCIGKQDVYIRTFSIIKKFLNNILTKSLIVNIKSDLEDRIFRNEIRKKNGGHYVPPETMKTTYKEETFVYNQTDVNKGFFEIDQYKIPVFSFINKQNEPNMFTSEMKKYCLDAFNYYSNVKQKYHD